MKATENHKLMALVRHPDFFVKSVIAYASDPLSVLSRLFPEGEKVIFYDGSIVESNISFEKLRMSHFDRISIVPSLQLTPKTQSFWKKASKAENRLINDSAMKKEVSRLLDLQTAHHENSTLYPKIVDKIFSILNNISNSPQTTQIEWTTEQKPNEQPLPTIW
jgi:hypothetical protein